MNKKQYNILLVEDVKIAQIVAISTLEDLNCNIDVAENGLCALQLAGKKYYDMILMDLGLPDIDGFKVTENIRKSQGKSCLTQIFALTAHLSDDYKQKAQVVGMSGFMQKPLTVEEVKHVLERLAPHSGK